MLEMFYYDLKFKFNFYCFVENKINMMNYNDVIFYCI